MFRIHLIDHVRAPIFGSGWMRKFRTALIILNIFVWALNATSIFVVLFVKNSNGVHESFLYAQGLVAGVCCLFLALSSTVVVYQGRMYWVHQGDSELLRNVYIKTRIYVLSIIVVFLATINGVVSAWLVNASPLLRPTYLLGTARDLPLRANSLPKLSNYIIIIFRCYIIMVLYLFSHRIGWFRFRSAKCLF